MHKNNWLYIFSPLAFSLIFFHSACLSAARNRPSYEEDKSVMMREILDSLDNLRHEVNNHEAEIRMFEEKFKNQEEILDTLRNQMTSTLQAVKETLKSQSATLDARLATHENAAKGLSTDFKSYTNDYAQTLSDYKRRIVELEKMIDAQNHNIENLQAALNSLMDALQIKDTPQDKTADSEPGSPKIYRVKSGDSLEKIARQNQTTIKKLKELNNLTSDQIIIGQKLKLPE